MTYWGDPVCQGCGQPITPANPRVGQTQWGACCAEDTPESREGRDERRRQAIAKLQAEADAIDKRYPRGHARG